MPRDTRCAHLFQRTAVESSSSAQIFSSCTRLLRVWLCLVWLSALVFPGQSVSAPLEASISEKIVEFTLSAVKALPIAQPATAQSPAPRIQIDLGSPDPRLQLTPCGKVEPYLLPGLRLTGSTRIGLKCSDGSTRWRISIPIKVSIYAQGLIAVQPLTPGTLIQSHHLALAEIDWASEDSPALTFMQAAEGRILARSVQVGQSLRQSHLKPRQWFVAGDTVKLWVHGPGFSISTQGEALSHGLDGQTVKVKTERGRIISGTAIGERQVRLSM